MMFIKKSNFMVHSRQFLAAFANIAVCLGTLSGLQSNALATELQPTVKGTLAKYYETIDELVAESDVVVLGRFEGNPKISAPRRRSFETLPGRERVRTPQVKPTGSRVPGVQTSPDAITPGSLDPQVIDQYLSTRDPGRRELAFRPTQTLKGSPTSVIMVGQRAIFKGSTVRASEDDTLFKAGDTYILFLKKALPHEGEIYWITGATQGAFPVINGRVSSRNVTGEIPKNVGPQVKKEGLDNFLAMIREKVRKPQ
jgi:hypothetical protein